MFSNFSFAAEPLKGNVTGGKCLKESDCHLGCIGNGDPTCISVKEGSAECLKTKMMGPGGLKCGCVTSVNQCGFLFPVQVQIKK